LISSPLAATMHWWLLGLLLLMMTDTQATLFKHIRHHFILQHVGIILGCLILSSLLNQNEP
jgi:ABC-type enterochelin transport system permease subunit